MATIITSECINCGACEPECPNTAIYQGDVEWEFNGETHPAISNDIFYIVPQKCTECVGFHDQEACAAVCPVDCCVPNPDIVESEALLLSRAKELHPEQTFGDDFPSRFRAEGAQAPAAAPPPATQPVAPALPAPASTTTEAATDSFSVAIPEVDDWDVPIDCVHCEGDYTVPFRYFRIGVVFYCPHCTVSFVVTSTIYKKVASVLDAFHSRWNKTFTEFQEKRRREMETFEEQQKQELENFSEVLKKIAAGATPPGKPHRRLSLFGFQWVG
jgi:ferredoxin/uncharacterized Zn finger protein (UPF0148 family)